MKWLIKKEALAWPAAAAAAAATAAAATGTVVCEYDVFAKNAGETRILLPAHSNHSKNQWRCQHLQYLHRETATLQRLF